MITFSVLPSMRIGTTPTQSINATLSAHSLSLCADAVFLCDNDAATAKESRAAAKEETVHRNAVKNSYFSPANKRIKENAVNLFSPIGEGLVKERLSGWEIAKAIAPFQRAKFATIASESDERKAIASVMEVPEAISP